MNDEKSDNPENPDRLRSLRAIKVYQGKTPKEMDYWIEVTNTVSLVVDHPAVHSFTFEMLTSGSRLRLPFTADNIRAYPNVVHGGGMILCKN